MSIKRKISISDLEQKGMITTLIALLSFSPEKPANMTILKNKVGIHNQTLEAKVQLLKTMKFVETRKDRGIPGCHNVWLTEYGYKLAIILAQADEALHLQ